MSKSGFKLVTLVLLGVVAMLAATGCIRIITGSETLAGSAELEMREFDFAGFKRIGVGNAFEVDVVRSDAYRVSVTLNDNLFDYLDISKRGETLVIRMKPGFSFRRATMRASVSLPELRELNLSGAVRGMVTGFNAGHDVELAVSGASSLNIDDLEVGDARIDASGASRVTGSIEMADGSFDVSGASSVELTGRADSIDLDVSGASTARLAAFPVTDADISVSGASRADVSVSGDLTVAASGASTVTYGGSPVMRSVQVSGGSSLSQR